MKDFNERQRYKLRTQFPDYDRFGVLGVVGGSWKSSSDRAFPICKSHNRLVVWKSKEILYCDCLNCWNTEFVQLVLSI